MTDFTAARINMVDSQIHTMGVVNEDILESYRVVRREDFVPAERRGIAYCDEDLPVSAGRFLMEPVTHARMMQAVLPQKNETVLDIGGATGYSAAILSRLAARVVAVESDAALLSHAEKMWAAQGCSNIMPHQGPFEAGYVQTAPYQLIFVNGGMADVPHSLIDQIAPGGRMICVIRRKEERIGRATIWTKNAQGHVSDRILFDAAVPCLPGHEPRNEFVF